MQKGRVEVVFDHHLLPVAKDIIPLYQESALEIQKILNWPFDFNVTIVLINDSHRFEQLAHNRHIVAYAIPDRHLIVMDYPKIDQYSFVLKSVLKHEMCHLVLNQNIPRGNLPRFLDEGIAQWVSDGLSELIFDTRHISLKRAILTRQIIPFKDLWYGFPADKKQMTLAYEQSKQFVISIQKKFGTKGILSILDQLHQKKNLNQAFMLSFGMPLSQFEAIWIKQIYHQNTWVMFLLSYLYEILFFIAALITVVGFIRKWRIKRKYAEIEDDEDYPHYFS